jgi:hypothetical protein
MNKLVIAWIALGVLFAIVTRDARSEGADVAKF